MDVPKTSVLYSGLFAGAKYALLTPEQLAVIDERSARRRISITQLWLCMPPGTHTHNGEPYYHPCPLAHYQELVIPELDTGEVQHHLFRMGRGDKLEEEVRSSSLDVTWGDYHVTLDVRVRFTWDKINQTHLFEPLAIEITDLIVASRRVDLRYAEGLAIKHLFKVSVAIQYYDLKIARIEPKAEAPTE